MPGIVGLITRMPRDLAERELCQMLETLHHEPFYVAGIWSEESLGVYVGWMARKGSFADGMPLRNERGDVALVFSGEEFPEPEIAHRLRERGHNCDVTGPGYLVHLYEEDPSFPARLNGRFHGLVTDRIRGTAMLFNDRYGMHRIYYRESNEAFYFASEAKAILAVRPELRKIDPRGMGEFVACGCTLEDRSLFEGLHVMPGGSKWVFHNGRLARKEKYFDRHEWESQEELEQESFYRELRSVFSRNLSRYFDGPERIGMSLTAGLDTRMIMAWANASPGSLPCYTFGGMLRDCQDVLLARRVAGMCEQSYQVIRVEEEFLARFPHYAERAVYLTDGCVDVGRAPDLYLNERARAIAPVRLTGLYGGEIMRRVCALKSEEPLPGLFNPDFLAHVHLAGETYSEILRGHPLSFAVFKQGPWCHYGVLSLEETQLSVRSPYLDNDFVRMVFRAPASCLASNEVCLRLISEGNGNLLKIPTDRGLAGESGRFLGEASRHLLEFLFKAEYAYDMGMPQWMARLDHVFSPLHFERLFLGRHKILHFRTWYRDALAGHVRELLLDARSLSRTYIEREALEGLVKGHLKGDHNYTTEIHKLLTLELLHRLFIDGGTALRKDDSRLQVHKSSRALAEQTVSSEV